jgi:hypothetical protein
MAYLKWATCNADLRTLFTADKRYRMKKEVFDDEQVRCTNENTNSF